MFAWPVGVSWCHWHLNGKHQADIRNPICCEASASTASSPCWSKWVHIFVLNRRDDDINLIRDKVTNTLFDPLVDPLFLPWKMQHLSKKLTSCLFCNICVIFEWPWLSHILPCDGVTEFFFLLQLQGFFVCLSLVFFLSYSLHHPFNHGLEISGFSLKSEWLSRDWVRNGKASSWRRTVGIEFFSLP